LRCSRRAGLDADRERIFEKKYAVLVDRGTLWVEVAAGGGSTFRRLLPAKE
jgi:hypothetical protein